MSDDEDDMEKTQIFLPGAQKKAAEQAAAKDKEDDTGVHLRPQKVGADATTRTQTDTTTPRPAARPAAAAGAATGSSSGSTMMVVVVLAVIAALGFFLLR